MTDSMSTIHQTQHSFLSTDVHHFLKRHSHTGHTDDGIDDGHFDLPILFFPDDISKSLQQVLIIHGIFQIQPHPFCRRRLTDILDRLNTGPVGGVEIQYRITRFKDQTA